MSNYEMAECLDCQPRFPQPFTMSSERDEWAQGHHDGTGHTVITYSEPFDVPFGGTNVRVIACGAADAALEANPTRCSVDCCLDADHSGPHMGDDGGEWPNANPRGES